MKPGTKITKGKTNATQGNARVAGVHGKAKMSGKGRGGHQAIGNSTSTRVVTLGGSK